MRETQQEVDTMLYIVIRFAYLYQSTTAVVATSLGRCVRARRSVGPVPHYPRLMDGRPSGICHRSRVETACILLLSAINLYPRNAFMGFVRRWAGNHALRTCPRALRASGDADPPFPLSPLLPFFVLSFLPPSPLHSSRYAGLYHPSPSVLTATQPHARPGHCRVKSFPVFADHYLLIIHCPNSHFIIVRPL